MNFRGTIDDLTDLNLEITLTDGENLLQLPGTPDKKCLVSLRGIDDFNFVKATIKL